MYSKRCFTNEIERLKPLKMAALVVFFHAVLIDTQLQYGVLKVWLFDSCSFFYYLQSHWQVLVNACTSLGVDHSNMQHSGRVSAYCNDADHCYEKAPASYGTVNSRV